MEKVFVEMQRMQDAMSAFKDVCPTLNARWGEHPKETGAIRRASMDLTRALANLRKSDYCDLPGEPKK